MTPDPVSAPAAATRGPETARLVAAAHEFGRAMREAAMPAAVKMAAFTRAAQESIAAAQDRQRRYNAAYIKGRRDYAAELEAQVQP